MRQRLASEYKECVVENLPIVSEYLEYETLTKQEGLDHCWGQLKCRATGKVIGTIDFWCDQDRFWRSGEDGFGWTPDAEPGGEATR
jgi:hypothetical protein